jgi:hypothetical protein
MQYNGIWGNVLVFNKHPLCNIRQFEEYVKIFIKYYFLGNPPKNEYWLEQFFNKLPSPWDEMCRGVNPVPIAGY